MLQHQHHMNTHPSPTHLGTHVLPQDMAFISPLSLKLSNLSCISQTHTQMGRAEGNGVNILKFLCTGSFSLIVTLQGQLSAQDFNQVLREQTWKSNRREESRLRKKNKNEPLGLSFPELQLRSSLLSSQLWAEEYKRPQRAKAYFQLDTGSAGNPRPTLPSCS